MTAAFGCRCWPHRVASPRSLGPQVNARAFGMTPLGNTVAQTQRISDFPVTWKSGNWGPSKDDSQVHSEHPSRKTIEGRSLACPWIFHARGWLLPLLPQRRPEPRFYQGRFPHDRRAKSRSVSSNSGSRRANSPRFTERHEILAANYDAASSFRHHPSR